MDKPEVRMVAILGQSDGQPVKNQRAIPWCTTHDLRARKDDDRVCPGGGWVGVGYSTRCQISSGGPDHKWWVDV